MNLFLFVATLGFVHAGTLYVNGVRADSLRDQEFKNVNVRIDSAGDIYIDAKNYTIKVIDVPMVSPIEAASVSNAVAPGHYWLVTEDNASGGHVVEVRINGVLIRTIRSGDPQVIIDIGQYLRPGDNEITMTALEQPYPPSGGSMHIYVGPGRNDNGVVRMDSPPIDFVRRSTDTPSAMTRSYHLKVE